MIKADTLLEELRVLRNINGLGSILHFVRIAMAPGSILCNEKNYDCSSAELNLALCKVYMELEPSEEEISLAFNEFNYIDLAKVKKAEYQLELDNLREILFVEATKDKSNKNKLKLERGVFILRRLTEELNSIKNKK